MFLNVKAKASVLSNNRWEPWVVNTDMIVYVRPHVEGGLLGMVEGQLVVDEESYRKVVDAVKPV
jgi:hypothetical protein